MYWYRAFFFFVDVVIQACVCGHSGGGRNGRVVVEGEGTKGAAAQAPPLALIGSGPCEVLKFQVSPLVLG